MADNLTPISISEILDKQFFVPHYQRGYRWTEQQVTQLLDDIDTFIPKEIAGKTNEKTFYCLQPVVVRLLNEDLKNDHGLQGEWFEVIDGQQRLTTIFLILQYINQKWLGEEKISQFKLFYETRPSSAQFLTILKVNTNNTVDIDKSYIDYYHMSTALKTINLWRQTYEIKKGKALNTANFQSKLFEFSKIIWYVVSAEEKNSRALFERLNLGKIPLTNAELTKALFLSSDSFAELTREERKIKQYEIARLWDEMEHKLSETDLKFWSFITNKNRCDYETKIDLILDLISKKDDGIKDPLYTFLSFTKSQNGRSLNQIWENIEQFYFTLLEWYNNKDFYHKIGYLIAAKQFASFKNIELHELVKSSLTLPKEKFEQKIDDLIRDSVRFELSELRYKDHPNQIFNLLLLFNVETNRTTDAISEFYPFKQHKGTVWSLEHIHARNSENFDKNKREPWQVWLDYHLPLVIEVDTSNLSAINNEDVKKLVEDIRRYNNPQLTWEHFDNLFRRVNDLLSINKESLDRDCEGLVNLALLSQPDNAALNNSVFEVKRREILRLDKKGSFIPVCTRRVFMKYYNDSNADNQQFFWSEKDRDNYLKSLKEKLELYLTKHTVEENEDE